MIAIRCPDCQTEIQRPDADAGKTIFCSKCYFALVLPQPAPSAGNTIENRFQTTEPSLKPLGMQSAEEFVVVCPLCYGSTDSLKAIEIRNVVFMWVFIIWNSEHVVGCSKCVRSTLLSRMLTAIPATNLLFPIYGLTYWFQFLAAGSKGPSDPMVAGDHRMTMDQYLEQAKLEKPKRRNSSWIVVALLLLLIGGIAFMVIFRLTRR